MFEYIDIEKVRSFEVLTRENKERVIELIYEDGSFVKVEVTIRECKNIIKAILKDWK